MLKNAEEFASLHTPIPHFLAVLEASCLSYSRDCRSAQVLDNGG